MFVWLASYPKSGNTLVRSILAAYFFSKDGVFNFDLLKNLPQFPNSNLFEKMGIDISNEKEVIKNYIKAQESFNNKNSIQFIKTHSYLFNINNNLFTDLNNSLGVIYIVRDPRNIVTSFAKHGGTSVDTAVDGMINKYHFGGNLNSSDVSERTLVYSGTWNSNFNSWKSFKYQERYLLIKYEDLINKKKDTFINILKFLYKLQNKKLIIDKKKIENVLFSTSFEKMKNLEKKKGFDEAKNKKDKSAKITFFNLGPKNDWNKLLDKKNKLKIETAFKKEMIELGYL